jgi:bifunctional DNA-binding transcriptional regulator/antitoxin component of YhaV-PrlF toxin-antitoxin module
VEKGSTMTQNLPAETIKIAPEALEVANCYLQLNDPKKVAEELDLAPDLVVDILKRREVRQYIDSVFFDSGYNNRFLMRRAMDALIKQKFQELEEAGTGSQKDISELLALSHKMSMDLLDKEIQLEKIRSGTAPQKQVNVQINEGLEGSKYSQLVQRLITGEGV